MLAESQPNPKINPLYKATMDSCVVRAEGLKKLRNKEVVAGLGLLTLGAITLTVFDSVSFLVSLGFAGSGIVSGGFAIQDELERREVLRNPHLDLTP